MLAAHRRTHSISAGFALLLSMLATGVYVSSNAAIPMLALAQQHAAATTNAQRWALVGAGEAALARGEDFTPGTVHRPVLQRPRRDRGLRRHAPRTRVLPRQRVGGHRRPFRPHAVHGHRHVRSGAVPTLILCGRHDPQYPPACSEELAAGINGAELVWFESSGHYPYIDEPEAFFAAVGQFLDAANPNA
jgi:pimeloyl-ACP methyl ester carboxylesterase